MDKILSRESESKVWNEKREPVPYLYSMREYAEPSNGKTTTCEYTPTSPVKEYGPDD